MRTAHLLILSLMCYIFSTTYASSAEFHITIEQLLSVTDGQEVIDSAGTRWSLEGANPLLAHLDRDMPESLLESPALQLHSTPIILSSDNTGPGMFFSNLMTLVDEDDYPQIAFKFHIPTICLLPGADPRIAEIYLVRRITLSDALLYPRLPNFEEVEARYRESLTITHAAPEVLRPQAEAPLNREERKELLWIGAFIGIVSWLIANHFLTIFLYII